MFNKREPMEKGRYIRDKEGKINLILETFEVLVNRAGYDKLSTRHIAKEAGISVGTIYHYFPGGKHSIAMGFLERLTQGIFDPSLFMTARDESGLKVLYTDFTRRHLASHRENVEIHRALDQAILADKAVREHNSEVIMMNLRSAAEELMKRGLYREVPTPNVEEWFLRNFKLIEAVVHRHLLVEPFFETDEELVNFISQILLLLHRDRVENEEKSEVRL
jgi:AcrR family transcriptional regulator